jgi:oxygen-independent coproporphyrinogen-3 oxidase
VEAIGVYVHFPYCLKKCPYCDFVSFAKARADIDHAGYADAVLAELGTRRSDLEGRRVETVFFGGGTPSLWEPYELGRVLAGVLGAASEVADDLEVTAECNPSSLDEARARALLGVGVNRLSVGVQGLSEERLRFLGRLHDPAGALAAVHAAIAAGTPRVSGDVIFAVETEREAARAEDARADVATVADTGVTHLSAYALTIEPKTAFGELARKGKLPIATDDAQADAFLAVEAELEARGFAHYEVSNYAKPGAEARHNLGYWEGRDYLGLGCGAVGTVRGRRWRNVATPEGYLAGALGRGPLESSREELDAETRLAERIMLGLRLDRGVDVAAAALDLGVVGWTPSREKAAARLVRAGRVEVEGGRVRVTKRARLFTDGIAAELM